MGCVAQVVEDALAGGAKALRRGQWDVAREQLPARARDQRSGRAWEGLAWAAWWLCDEELNFEARERAYRAYRAEDDPCGAARAAAWMAGDYMDYRGEHAVADRLAGARAPPAGRTGAVSPSSAGWR